MKKIGLALIVFCVLILAFGCMQKSRIADLTIMSSKNISTLEGAKEMGIFEGKDCRSVFGGQMPNMEEALDKACEAGGGNAMVDAVIYYKPANCIFDDHCYEIKGTVVKTRDLLKSEIQENSKLTESDYIKEILTSPSGHEYLAFKKKTAIELDNDKKHYDLIIRVK